MPRRRQRKLPELSHAQREIMEFVWERGEVSTKEVREYLLRSRPVARNTVRTFLERMEDKGWLHHREDGKTFLYSATQARQATIGEKVREMIDSLCGGSPEVLVNALLDYRGLSQDELHRIRRLLEEAKAKRARKSRS